MQNTTTITQQPPEEYSVLVADDSDDLREAVKDMLECIDGFKVCDEATDGDEAIELARIHRPDLVLMDIRMPNTNGLQATQEITTTMPKTSVLVFTTHEDPEYILTALKHGAAGYLLKDAPLDEFEETIRSVFRGENPMNSDLMKRTLNLLARQTKKREEENTIPHQARIAAFHGSPLDALTEKEYECLVYVCEGHTNPRIAECMWVELTTVKGYIERILDKLNVGNRTQAARKAIEYGILTQRRQTA